ncbi:hypothetical protein WA026_005162 [Henosepilachna vigintioctopunctata]|uniref:Fatty acid synthase n=1 Tax=Henosepilachna vigintioctopunctata TaxID=420089 RepID=A0AAW1UUS6_9CUCU
MFYSFAELYCIQIPVRNDEYQNGIRLCRISFGKVCEHVCHYSEFRKLFYVYCLGISNHGTKELDQPTHPPPGEEICITGISGVYPSSEDVHQFRDNLYNKVDMVSDKIQRWDYDHPEIPKRGGRIPNIQKFDAGFFGVHYRQADCMDPSVRIFLEKSVEAIFDAGLHPSDLEGTRTGVFVGSCFSEAERHVFYDNLEPQHFGLTGVLRSMIANRVSYFLKLKGPSYISDTACSSAFFALENAYGALRRGLCDMALVGGTSVTLHPLLTLQFSRLGVLGLDGCCKSFDASGNGYVRSEAISCMLLQKSKDSKRIYGKIIHTKTNCDGFKPQSITYPLGDAQKVLLDEFYEECGVDPRDLSYLEAHVTGTKVGDPEEMNAMDKIFCTGRKTPLLVGGVKSNMGHPEPSSGMCALTKCIIGMEEGYIPPNIHYSTPREGIEALEHGRVRVVVNKTPFEDDRGLIGINNFGFGGSNGHVLLHWNPKKKINGGEPSDDLPRLVCLSGRVPEAITSLTEDVNSRKLDAEHIALLHEIFRKDISEHRFRGYTIASKSGMIASSCKPSIYKKVPFLLALGTFGSSWQKVAKQLMNLPVFASTMKKIHDILKKRQINITEIIQNSKVIPIDPVLTNVLGNIATQIGIIEVFKDLNVRPWKVIGYSLAELVCAYYDGSLSLEQVILSAYEVGNHIKDINKPSLVYVVHKSEEEILKLLPKEIEVIWQNTDGVVTISGEPDVMKKFVMELGDKKIKAKEICRNEVTLHSVNNKKLESELVKKLQQIISIPKERNGLWLSTTSDGTSSPEYFAKVLYTKMQAKHLGRYIQKNYVITELGSGSFANILKVSLDESVSVTNFSLESGESGFIDLLKIIGNLYENGLNPLVQRLYPKVQFPVSRGTPMIAPKIKWDHSKDWFVMRYVDSDAMKCGERTIGVSLKEEEWEYVSGHVVDGRNLFPGMGYIYIVWDTLAIVKHSLQKDMKVIFENCKFNRATNVGKEVTNFNVSIQGASGGFEISEGGTVIVTGNIFLAKDDEVNMIELPKPCEDHQCGNLPLTGKDVYKELRLRGYNYQGAFRAIESVNYQVTRAYIRWDGNWVAFMDNMLQLLILQMDTRLLYVPTSISQMIIDAKKHLEYVESFGDNPLLPVFLFKNAGIIRCGGIEIRGLKASAIVRRKPLGLPVLEKYEFVANEGILTLSQCLRVNMQLALENMYTIKLRVVELVDDATENKSEILAPTLIEIFGDQPLVQATV